MKTLNFILFILMFPYSVFAQNTVEKKEYYDYSRTRIKKIWHELGDGTYNGLETGYDENGIKAYTVNWRTGIQLNIKSYYQDGSIIIEANKNANDKFDGLQKYFLFDSGKRYLKSSANVKNGDVMDFINYNSDGSIDWSYKNDGIKKEYNENNEGKVTTQLIFENSQVSGFIENRAKFQSNEIMEINENYVVGKKDGDKLFIQNKEEHTNSYSDKFNQYNEKHTDSYRTKIYDNKCDIKAEIRISHPSWGVSYELSLKVIKSDDNEILNNVDQL